MTTTGEVARAAGISDKAVRLYAARGLLDVRQDETGDRRVFGPEAGRQARTIALLRGLDLSLEQIGAVLVAADPTEAFDAVWDERRGRLGAIPAAAVYARSVLAGSPRIEQEVRVREIPERMTLDLPLRATLPEMAAVITAGTARVFDLLGSAGVDLAGSPFVEHHERATEGWPARLTLRVPIAAPVRPAVGTAVTIDPAHTEAWVALDQDAAADQGRIVAVHDHLASGAFSTDLVPAGDDREIYLPTWGTGEPGPVMEIAVPVVPAREPASPR
jgi:DNA-binding transcriptional MerR regulator